MTIDDFRAKWEARLKDADALGSLVPMSTVAADVLRDVWQLECANDRESVTLKEARVIGGYSVDHLARLIALGRLENVGRKHRPRIRRTDVPIKPGYVSRGALLKRPPDDQFDVRRRIVASALTRGTP